MNRTKMLLLAIAGLMYSCQPQSEQQQKDQLAGMWSLHIMELQDHENRGVERMERRYAGLCAL